MELREFIERTIREYLNEQNIKQPKNSNLNSHLWNLVNSEFFMSWSNNWSDVLLDENNEPAIFYRGLSFPNGKNINWNFNKSFFTMNKSYAQSFAINLDDGSFNKDSVFSFFLKSKFTINVEDYYKGTTIDSYRVKTKYNNYQDGFKDYTKFLSDFKKADIIKGDEDGSGNFSYYVKNDRNVLPIDKLIQIVKK
jgi:hypothetical protein